MLPMIHSNPFDRFIMATAIEEGMQFITHDSKIQKYDIDLLL